MLRKFTRMGEVSEVQTTLHLVIPLAGAQLAQPLPPSSPGASAD